MDNCAIHHVPEVYKLFDDTGILLLFEAKGPIYLYESS